MGPCMDVVCTDYRLLVYDGYIASTQALTEDRGTRKYRCRAVWIAHRQATKAKKLSQLRCCRPFEWQVVIQSLNPTAFLSVRHRNIHDILYRTRWQPCLLNRHPQQESHGRPLEGRDQGEKDASTRRVRAHTALLTL